MHDNLLPGIWVCQRHRAFANPEDTWYLLELRDDKFGNHWRTQPNLANFGLSGLHQVGMYGIILH